MTKPLFIFGILLLISTTVLKGQETPSFQFDEDNISLSELAQQIESQSLYFVAYNVALAQTTIYLPNQEDDLSLDQLIEAIERTHIVAVNSKVNKIIISERKSISINGVVRDSLSGEALQAVSIFSQGKELSLSNEQGYFNIEVGPSTETIQFNYIGFESLSIAKKQLLRGNTIILMNPIIQLPHVVIKDSLTSFETPFNPKDAKKNINQSYGFSGTADVIQNLKKLPGVSVGSEAQTGFIVRGGNTGQNLVLIDGLPIYEVSHLGGLTSVLIDKTIKSAKFYKGGIPSRFGGKLTSVLDVRLKDGNRRKTLREFNLNLENLNGFIEGPLGPKTAFLFNGRLSLFNLYLSPIVSTYTDYKRSNFNYNDVYTKVSHWFSPSHKLSASLFSGRDAIELRREDSQNNLLFNDINNLNWHNQILSLDWNFALSKKLFSHAQIGISRFNSETLSANSVTLIDSTENSEQEINAISQQNDLSIYYDIDYYSPNFGVFKFGLGFLQHSSSPDLNERTSFSTMQAEPDSTYISVHNYLFVENKLSLSPTVSLNIGLRYNLYTGLETTYSYLLPRINLLYTKTNFRASLGYSKMNQFVHLLVNPSSGLPSDLWVPSTARIQPEEANLFSIDTEFNLSKDLSLGISGFYNQFYNLLEYSNPTDILKVLVIEQTLFNINTEDISWEDRVTQGDGSSRGLEFALNLKKPKFELSMAYTYSSSIRQFEFQNIDGIQEFPYKYDRPHDLNLAAIFRIKQKYLLKVNWVFGNGNRYTVPVLEKDISNQPIFVSRERNNVQLTDFHRLNVSFEGTKEIYGNQLKYTFGIYNLYNRQNPFYSYIEAVDEAQLASVRIKEISLFPIFPQINVSYSW